MNLPGCHYPFRWLLLVATALIPAMATAQVWRSSLYPENWQRPGTSTSFEIDKLIQDFSYAGYRRGEEPIPDISGPVFDVTTYGADPGGTGDSTVAIQNAIDAAAAAGGGVVYLPAGEFRVSPQGANTWCLRISTSRIVLRGAGTAATFLLNTSHIMNGKAVIQVSPPSTSLGTTRSITADLPGPARRIPVENAASFAPGNIVRLQWGFTDEWIVENNQQTWWNETKGRPANATYHREVTATNPTEGWIEIDVPTRYTMKTRDAASLRTVGGLLNHVGVESLSMGNLQHPGTGWGEEDYTDPTKAAYDAHASWLIRFQNVRDCWISSVHSRQAAANTSTCHMLSNGVSLVSSMRVTVRNCEMRRPQYGGGGGNGYMYRVQSSNECLIRNSIADFSRHGFVISHAGTSGNVFFQCEDRETQRATGSTGSYTTSGSGSDNHMHFSHSNLWDQCHAHNSFWTAHHRTLSGTTPHGVTSAHAVYWNTTGSGTRGGSLVRSEQLHHGYVIGTSGARNAASNPTGGNTAPADHLEGIAAGATLVPQSLYLDQLSRRLSPVVTYAGNGATAGTAPVDGNSPYAAGGTVTVTGAGDLVRTGYRFTGWNTAADGSGTTYQQGDTFTIDNHVTLHAQWSVRSYTVTFDANGGTAPIPASMPVTYGSAYGTLAVTERSGCHFEGWFTDPTGGSPVTSLSEVAAASDHVLYARWNLPPVADAGTSEPVSLAGTVPWTPAAIPMEAWYDAADAVTITAPGGFVSRWDDKSGNGKHLIQSDAARQPATGMVTVNGMNAIDFTSDFLFNASGTNADIKSVLMVIRNRNEVTGASTASGMISIYGTAISAGDGLGSSTGAFSNEILSVFDEDASNVYIDRQAVSTNVLPTIPAGPHLYGYVRDTDWFIGLDGSGNLRDLSSGTRRDLLLSNGFGVGAMLRNPATPGNFLDGAICEVILLSSSLGEADRRKLEGYLAHKWSLVANLPADHPYKDAAPAAAGAVITLGGAVSDPDGDSLNSSWNLVSGPGTVMFANPTAPVTTATFTAAGTYTLRLSADDGFGTGFDEVVITVEEVRMPTPFETWTGGGEATFTGDANGDGLADGLAWLLGALNPIENAGPLLPSARAVNGALEVNFRMLNPSKRGGAVLGFQYGTDLGSWTTVAIPGQSGTHEGVEFVIIPDGDIHHVKAIVPASAAGSQGRLFVRLRGESAAGSASQ